MREDMVGPRYDVSGTSQRTKSHLGASAPLVKLMSVLPDGHPRVCPRLTAGLLARGSIPFVAFPGPRFPVAHDERFSAYSCGGSHGIGGNPRTAFPFDPQRGEPSLISRSLAGEESMLIVGHGAGLHPIRILFAVLLVP